MVQNGNSQDEMWDPGVPPETDELGMTGNVQSLMDEYDLPDYPEEEEHHDAPAIYMEPTDTVPSIKPEPDDDIPGFMTHAALINQVRSMLSSTGLNQESIAARIMAADDPEVEVQAIFNEAYGVINEHATGRPNKLLKDEFKAAMTDLINGMNAKKRFKAGCARFGEVTGDVILSIPDLAVGGYQMILENSKMAAAAGSWLAKTFNKGKAVTGAKSTGGFIENLRKKGKATRARKGGAPHATP